MREAIPKRRCSSDSRVNHAPTSPWVTRMSRLPSKKSWQLILRAHPPIDSKTESRGRPRPRHPRQVIRICQPEGSGISSVRREKDRPEAEVRHGGRGSHQGGPRRYDGDLEAGSSVQGFIVREDPSPCVPGRARLAYLSPFSQSSRLSGTVTVAEAEVLLPHASVTR
jgi:hypothetical protein